MRGLRVALLDARKSDDLVALVHDCGGQPYFVPAASEPPADLRPLTRLVEEITERRVAAIAFTRRIQVEHLFRVADSLGLHEDLVHTLNARMLVAAVGPKCAAALESRGVTVGVVPERAQIGAMVASLAKSFERACASRATA